MDHATLAAVLNGLPIPALIVGRDERIAVMNPAAQALLGPHLLGRHHAMALRQPEVQLALTRALRNALPGEARHVLPGPSQDTVHRLSVTPLPDGTALCVFEDLSQAEQMGQMRRDFVANVSHELRSPLTALLGFIETLQGSARDDASARERFLAIMEREARRMNRLITDLLNLSRVEADERVRPSDRVDIKALLQSTLMTLRPVTQDAGVRVNLVEDRGDWIVLGDGDQLVQVFQNLIGNAVKYGGSGGVVEIRLTERFYRVDDHRARERGGTGLGLAIVKHIIHRHRGRMSVQSERGKGSTFSILLPRN